MKKSVYILGLNFAYHELAACILKDGVLIAAVEEERFSRIKRGKKALFNNPNVLPIESIKFCLGKVGISISDIDYIGLSFMPKDRLKNINIDQYFEDGDWGSKKGEEIFYEKILEIPALINKFAGQDLTSKMQWIPHHICHASSAFFPSPFRESAILSIDGIGELSSTWMGKGENNQIQVIKEISYPNSMGFLWEKISTLLGFSEYDSSKVMGLSAYGDGNRFYEKFQTLVQLKPEGEFTVDNDVLRFRLDDFQPLEKHFGVRQISSPADIGKDQEDIAAALQKITDDVVLHICKYISEKTKSPNLCMAGGVALNCVSNEKIMKSGYFKELFIQPAANDAGTALGSALYIWNQILKGGRVFTMYHPYWGPEYSDKDIENALKEAGVTYEKLDNIEQKTAQKLSEGKIIGWFQGRAEWGPRALGNRSLLVDPRNPDMKNILNERIKKREPFRPFAPSVLKEDAEAWFEIPKNCNSISTEFMEVNFDVKKGKRSLIPAVVHKDGTSRVQLVNSNTNAKYHRLISEFKNITGVPIVLNTSFNDNEPIVCSPRDAIKTFQRTMMDYLAIGSFFASKS